MRYLKVISILIVTALIFTSLSAVAGARDVSSSVISKKIEDTGVMKCKKIISTVSVNDKEIWVINKDSPVDVDKKIQGYLPINQEILQGFKEEGLKVKFVGYIHLSSIITNVGARLFIRGYLPIRLESIELLEPNDNKPPVADFVYEPEKPDVGQEVMFDAKGSYDPDGKIVGYKWDFGDKDDGDFTGINPIHIYEAEGTFPVKLTVTDDDGATTSIVKDVVVKKDDPEENEEPVADFSYEPLNPSTNDMIKFTDTSVDDKGVVSWWWEFGSEEETSTEQNPEYQFNEPGEYNVALTVFDEEGEQDTIVKSIKVTEPGENNPPVADFVFRPEMPNIDQEIMFDASRSHDIDGQIVSYIWDFGDTCMIDGKNAVHVYPEPGTYTVTLTVTDDKGASDTITKDITVKKEDPQPEYGTLSGIVREKSLDGEGCPIPNAKVLVMPKSDTIIASVIPKYVTMTNEEGRYKIDKVEPGEYNVVVFARGYKTGVLSTSVTAGTDVQLDFELEKGLL